MLPRIDDDLSVERFANALLAKLETALPPSARTVRGGRRRRLTIAGAAAVVAVCVALASLGGLPLGSGGAPIGSAPAPATAAELLRSVATAALRQPPLAAGQYLRVRMLRWSRGNDGRLHRVLFTNWMAADGSARFLIQPGTGSGFERSDERCTPRRCLLILAGQRPQPMGVARYGPGRGFTAAQLQRLPTDPGRLLAAIRARARTGTGPLGRDPWELGFPLLVAPVPPDVRAALYRALAALPGVRRVGAERVGGHDGIALSRRDRVPGSNVERVIVVDPRTGALLAARATVNGRLTDGRTYVVTVVGSTGATHQ
jgi:hypothetical protein